MTEQESAQDNLEKHPLGKRVHTDGGAYVEGAVNTSGGDFVGRDQVKTVGTDAESVSKLFQTVYATIENRPHMSPEDKSDLKAEVKELELEVVKGDKANEGFLARRLRNIQRMAPDILEVVTATLTNPKAGFAVIVRKVAAKMGTSKVD